MTAYMAGATLLGRARLKAADLSFATFEGADLHEANFSGANLFGVQNEIEETLAREAREGGEALLIPVTVDDYVFRDWAPKNPDVAQAVRDRVVADFRGTDDEGTFKNALVRLLGALRKKAPSEK